MNRLEAVRKFVDNILMEQSDFEERRCGYIHLYGVSATCGLFALKRGLNVELCEIAGMLHDISSYKTGCSVDHARLSSIEARVILNEIDCFSDEEIDIICSSILSHSNKQDIDNPYNEILKDADVLQHYLYNTSFPIKENEMDRMNVLFEELGIR
jgi:uncharacterized protein